MHIQPKLYKHPNFSSTIEQIRKINLSLTNKPVQMDFDLSRNTFPPNGKIHLIEDLGIKSLNLANGAKIAKKHLYSGYDESKLQYNALEGIANFTAHSLVLAGNIEYVPVSLLSFNFYTRSSSLSKNSEFLKYTEDISSSANEDYILERSAFLEEYGVSDSILFIDGPLVGGNITHYQIKSVEVLNKKNIIPIFIVKNSESNLVTDNVPSIRGKFNSDMHWSYKLLKIGQRTNLFKYTDEIVSKNSKIFCYIKTFNASPQRVEFHEDTHHLFKDNFIDIFDLIFYLFLVHGLKLNPQIRPIAVAERYARDILKTVNSYEVVRQSGLTPTMNQERFGR